MKYIELLQIGLQHASWPIVTFLSLLIFKTPLTELVGTLKLKKLKAGSLEFVFNEQIKVQGFTEEQLKVLRKLSAQEIEVFLLASYSDSNEFIYRPPIHKAIFEAALLKLQEAGLLTLNKSNDVTIPIRHETTPLGQRVRAMVINSTVTLFHTST